MASKPPPPTEVGDIRPQNIVSYAAVVAGKSEVDPEQDLKLLDPGSIIFKELECLQGKPTITFSDLEQERLLGKVQNVLVGKFSHGRPPLAAIKEFFASLNLKGTINTSIYDSKHVFFECSNYFDFVKIWLQLSWTIKGFVMRMFKWGIDFHPSRESTIVPVWVRIEGLPLHMFDEMSLLKIAHCIGKPIKVNARNVKRTILNSARICVELDIAKPLLDLLWLRIVKETSGELLNEYRLQVFYDVLPLFCASCSHLGHGLEKCKSRKGKAIMIDDGIGLLETVQNRDKAKENGATASKTSTKVLNKMVAPSSSKAWIEIQKKQGPLQEATVYSQIAQAAESGLPNAGVAVTVGQGLLGSQHSIRQGKPLTSKSTAAGQSLKLAEPAEGEVAEPMAMREEGSNGQSNSGSAKSVFSSTVVQWQGAQHSHKKVWKQPSAQQNREATTMPQVKLFGVPNLQQNSDQNAGHQQNSDFVNEECTSADAEGQSIRCSCGTGAGCGADAGHACGQELDAELDVELLQHGSDEGRVHGGQVRGAEQVEVMPSPTRSPKAATVRPKSADSALGKKKKPMVQLRQLGPCTTAGPQRPQPPTKASWADEVEELEKQEAKDNRMAIEHSFQRVRTPREGYYKNMLILNIPGFQEMSPQQQQETAATTMAGFYQWKVTSALEEELRKDIVLREVPDSEQGWQVVTYKKKRSPSLKATPTEDRQRIKASLDPDYDVERLQARIQQMKRDLPPK